MPRKIDTTQIMALLSEWSKDLGFEGLASGALDLNKDHHRLLDWLKKGFHGNMNYMGHNLDKRLYPKALFPGTFSVVCVRMQYKIESIEDSSRILKDPQKAYKLKPFSCSEELFSKFIEIFENASKKKHLKILNSHPDLVVEKKSSSINRSISSIKSFFKYLMNNNLIEKDPTKIKMTTFFEIIEGPMGFMDCYFDSNCDQIHSCSIRTPIQRINDSIRDMFNNISLNDITRSV